jgi:hypothetical protein
LQFEKHLEHWEWIIKDLVAQVEDLTCKNHKLEWMMISLCHCTRSIADRISGREDRRHLPYLRARGYGNVLQRQKGTRSGGRAEPGHSAVEDSNVVLSDYRSDSE